MTPLAGPMSYMRCTVPISRGKTDAMVRARGDGHEDLAAGSSESPARVLSDGVVSPNRRCSLTGCQ
jgi:hypothetical protein